MYKKCYTFVICTDVFHRKRRLDVLLNISKLPQKGSAKPFFLVACIFYQGPSFAGVSFAATWRLLDAFFICYIKAQQYSSGNGGCKSIALN